MRPSIAVALAAWFGLAGDTTCLTSDTSEPGEGEGEGEGEVSAAGESSQDEDASPPVVLTAPPPPGANEDPAPASEPEGRTALAYQFNAPVYERPGSSTITGFVRRGTQITIARWVPGPGCTGSWYELSTGGYVCNTDGFDTRRGDKTLPEGIDSAPPQLHRPLPFHYAKVKTEATPLYWRVPSVQEESRARADSSARPEPVKERTSGAVFVAIEQWVQEDGRTFGRMPRGYYVAQRDLDVRDAPRMYGEALEGPEELPLAFIHVALSPIMDATSQQTVGTAFKHARFVVQDHVTVDDETWVVGPDQIAVPRAAVRIAHVRERPDRVPEGAQWIHVDLAEQTLVAYEGEQPVRATLISSGKPGYEPPLGVFRIHKKYVSKTMSGEDDVDGSYEVGQVPWTMYYWGSLALHGAYWHDDFGTVKSHGCTNIPPVDARWLFHWSAPDLPPGWHGKVDVHGPYLVFTDSSSEE